MDEKTVKAFNIVVNALEKANKSGVYSLQESSAIVDAIKMITPQPEVEVPKTINKIEKEVE